MIIQLEEAKNKLKGLRSDLEELGRALKIEPTKERVEELESSTLEAVKTALVPLLYGGLASVGVAYTLQIIAQKYSDPTFAAIVFSLESVFSAIGGALILSEKMSNRGYIGCVLIFGGIIISQLKFGKKKEVL